MAHFSEDPILLHVLKNGGDVFRKMASLWQKKTENEVTKEEREQAKGLVYGITCILVFYANAELSLTLLDGMGPKSLSENLLITESEAQRLIDKFRDNHAT